MASSTGPDLVTDGLVLALDVANSKCISPLGCTGFNNAPQLLKNLVSTSDTINSYNGVRLGNLSYYTAFAIDYPEGSFGGSAANRQGITPGYNVTSGTKLYAASRALHLWVWNNSTNSWLPNSYFNGSRLDGHCYDSYLTTAEVDVWVSDYNNIKNTFGNNITVIAMGSHRDRYHTTAQYDILKDLGAPNNVDTIINTDAPEWILVGKPGLGADNAYGWAFENYSTDSTRVAHLNFGLPIYGGIDNYLEFDGLDDYVDTNQQFNFSANSSFTVSCWVFQNSAQWSTGNGPDYVGKGRAQSNSWALGVLDNGSLNFEVLGSGNRYQATSTTPVQEWFFVVGKYDVGAGSLYVNGELKSNFTYPLSDGDFNRNQTVEIGRRPLDNSRVIDGKISNVRIYNRALTADEISQNFNATRTRFGI